MRQEAIDAIDAVEPYKGGRDDLWLLHELDITDKHRLLVAVGSHFQSVDIGPALRRSMEGTFSSITGITLPPMFIRPADVLFPLNVGDELFIDQADGEPNSEIQFRFNISLGEPGVPKGEPMADTLGRLVSGVDQILTDFDHFLASE